jgi:hypothetical protein
VSEAGEGWSDGKIAEALDTSVANVERTRRQLVEEGFEAVLTGNYNPNSAPPRIFDGAAEAKLIAPACGACSGGLRQMDAEPARRKSRRTEHRPSRPVVCLDETSKQMIVETRAPVPAAPGRQARQDYEYERNGVAICS